MNNQENIHDAWYYLGASAGLALGFAAMLSVRFTETSPTGLVWAFFLLTAIFFTKSTIRFRRARRNGEW